MISPSPASGAVAAAVTRHAPGPSAGPGAPLSERDAFNGERIGSDPAGLFPAGSAGSATPADDAPWQLGVIRVAAVGSTPHGDLTAACLLGGRS